MTDVSGGAEQRTLAEALQALAARDLGVSDQGRLQAITEVLLDLGRQAGPKLTGAEAHVAANRASSTIRRILRE